MRWLLGIVSVLVVGILLNQKGSVKPFSTQSAESVTPLPGNGNAQEKARHPSEPAANISEPKAQPKQTRAALSPEQIHEREHLMRMLTADEAMLNAKSYAERARIYCRYQSNVWGAGTLDDVERDYANVMKTEPPTQQEEIQRQYVLRAKRDRLSIEYNNYAACQQATTLPTDDQEREMAKEAKRRIIEIDGCPDPERNDALAALATSDPELAAILARDNAKTPSEAKASPSELAAILEKTEDKRLPEAKDSASQNGVQSSGLLHAIVEEEYGQAVFENLSAARLKFTFNHDAWDSVVHRQADGRQTLIMHSTKPGTRSVCDVRWEIAQ